MIATRDPHERSRDGIFHETPPAIHAACLKLLAARTASVASVGKRYPEEISYDDMMRIAEEARLAAAEVERVVGEHQGPSLLSGLYRVDGWLVGYRKGRHGKGGLQLVVHPTAETRKGLRS